MDTSGKFLDAAAHRVAEPDFWPPVIISRDQIDREVERLADLPAPVDGRRESLIVHPMATAPGLGLAPGIQVKLCVLKPGERTKAVRHNSTQVSFCIRGGGTAIIGGKRIDFSQYDVWNHPSFVTYSHVNDTDELQVRLSYSNAALLEKLGVHLVEENVTMADHIKAVASAEEEKDDPKRKSPYGSFQLTDDGAWLMPYELLISPPSVESPALHWQWSAVRKNLDKLVALGKDYVGRRLYLLYNPMTGRTNGTTPSFFATMTIRPPKIVDRPHRHISAAINYYFSGRGRSTVAGEVYEWEAGDLMLSAPGWAVHNHASYDEPVYELTIQDQPFNIAMESLLWQESLKEPAIVLGAQQGFATNRASVA